MSKINLLQPQKYLKGSGLIALIASMNMFVPLSIDMYLPALPHMTDYFTAPTSIINLTLVGFFFFYAVGILIFGPLSDKYGRKPVLIIGILLYMIFSGFCALSLSIWQLIFARVIQALGAGSMVAVSTALIKDCFSGKVRHTVLAVVQAMAVIGPMVAPLAGAFILQFATWRATFWVLVVIGALCLIAGIFLQESLPTQDRYTGTLAGSIGRLIVVGKNKGFTSFLVIVSLLAAPYMAYIAVCSYVYIDFFHLSTQVYSYLFAFNSAFAVLGPILYLKTTDRIKPKTFTAICFILALASGICLILLGNLAPWLFMLCFLPFTLIESAIRPFSTGILLNQQESDTGSASALINFLQTVLGSVGMLLGALPWHNFIIGLGSIICGCALLSILGWLLLLKSKIEIKGL